MRFLATLLLTTTLASTANAQSVVDSPSADETRLTIYPDNLAMVTEVRKVTLPKGKTTLRLFGVSDQIIPQTVVLQEFEGFSIEQNFTSDLLSKGSLLANAIGETVTIARVNPATGEVRRDEAKLVSAAQSTEYPIRQWDPIQRKAVNFLPVEGTVFEINGKLEALECSGLGEAIAFRKIPETLSPTPVLSIDVSSEIEGEAELVVNYLSSGISWSADYRVDVNPKHTAGEMLGWLTVTNSTAKTFDKVDTAIVAGEVNRQGTTDGTPPVKKTFQASCWVKGTSKSGINIEWSENNDQKYYTAWDGTILPVGYAAPSTVRGNTMMESDQIIVTASKRSATREDLGDYKLYRTPQPVTVAAHQTKQVAFLSVTDAELERLYKFNYQFEPTTEPRGAIVQYEIDNSKDGKLAQPLPKGTMRVMTQRANGRPAYLGEDRVDNLAVDLPVEIEISTSPSVMSSEETRGITKGQSHTLRLSGEIFNATPEDIVAEVELKNEFIRANNISASSHPLDPDEIIPTFKIPVVSESSQDYQIDLPVERVFSFIESSVVFKEDKKGAIDFNYPNVEYRLAGQYGGRAWPAEYFPDVEDDVELKSTLLSYRESGSAKNAVDNTSRLRHVFKNSTKTDVTVRFVSDSEERGLEVEITNPSFEAQSTDPFVWQFELKAGRRKTLEYTRRIVSGGE